MLWWVIACLGHIPIITPQLSRMQLLTKTTMPVIEHYRNRVRSQKCHCSVPEVLPLHLFSHTHNMRYLRLIAPQQSTRFTPQRSPLWRRPSYRSAVNSSTFHNVWHLWNNYWMQMHVGSLRCWELGVSLRAVLKDARAWRRVSKWERLHSCGDWLDNIKCYT